ncbi:MAG: YqjF family protein [Thermoleophilaceae bacterium]
MSSVRDSLDLLAAPVVQTRTTRVRDHRPWPMPRRPWVMAQTWVDLLFAHWSVEPAAVEDVVPSQLPLDTFDGRAWVGVTPFAVRNLRLALTFPVPFLSAFPEINVRTYVTVDGKPGIYFFSLDAGSRLAVAAARRMYRVPYFRARMQIERGADGVDYASERVEEEVAPEAAFRGRYRPAGETFEARAGTLEHFLTERYCLYTLDGRARVLRGDIHHPPWQLQPAEAEIDANTMGVEAGLDLAGEPLLHYSRRQDVVFWNLERV